MIFERRYVPSFLQAALNAVSANSGGHVGPNGNGDHNRNGNGPNGDGDPSRTALLWLICGIVLVMVGTVGGVAQLAVYQPFVFSVILGIISICVHVCMSIQEFGLLVLLPSAARDHAERILHQPLFDVLYFQSGLTDILRRWARVFLLCLDLTEAEIAEVTKGMSREFLKTILHDNVIDTLPPMIRELLVPQNRVRNNDEKKLDPDDLIIWDHSRMQLLDGPPAASEAVAEGRRPRADVDELIVNLLCEKKLQKERMLQPASLRPATQFIISNRLQAPFYLLRAPACQLGAWALCIGEWLCLMLSITSLYYPAKALFLTKGNWRSMSWNTQKYAGVCMLASTSFSLLGYQLRRKYKWLSDQVDTQ
eukprot:GEMP01027962.1.p1 GENE.GEMP01027962.1~~GEMP01027962.1.p1  ORF type:complete len:365 (+),score=54.81 GEMP01027962.1:76-1170(+)